ncbi:MAG: glycosyltransferase [Acidobacteriota bacterium]
MIASSPDSVRRPTITIGLPVYNGQKYLAVALDSLLAQTDCEFQLIISDNGSTDRTREICERYAAQDSRIRYYRNPQNEGVARNFNRVFTLSDTEYFKWAPYDDLVEPNFLARCLEVMERNPSVVLCYSKAKVINETGAFITNYDPGPDTHSNKQHVRFRNLLLHPEYAIQQMGVIRSSALRKTVLHGTYPSSDEVLLAQLALLGDFYEIQDRLYIFRRHEEQSTETSKQRDRVLYFDPTLAGKIVLPTWRYLGGYLKVLRNSSLQRSTLLSCYFSVLRWTIRSQHMRALGKDLLMACANRKSLPKPRPAAAIQDTTCKQDARPVRGA